MKSFNCKITDNQGYVDFNADSTISFLKIKSANKIDAVLECLKAAASCWNNHDEIPSYIGDEAPTRFNELRVSTRKCDLSAGMRETIQNDYGIEIAFI